MPRANRNSAPQPVVIDPNGWYRWHEAGRLLGLSAKALRRAHAEHGLRRTKRGNCYWTLGSWINEWFAKGEEVRPEAVVKGKT